MEKAYDLKLLLEELKKLGLDVAEDTAEDLFKLIMKWLKDSAVKSATPYDDIALVIIPKLEELVLAQIDKIDGKEG